jgi:hypothetical protein
MSEIPIVEEYMRMEHLSLNDDYENGIGVNDDLREFNVYHLPPLNTSNLLDSASRSAAW